jgi:hypothetical protein
MACGCIKDIIQKAIGTKVQRGEIITARYENIMLYVPRGTNTLATRTYSELTIECLGKKKEVKQPVVHKFCPFCGEAYGKLAELPPSV